MKVPSHIESIQPYIPGKPIEELERELGISGAVKLASNENPIGPSPKALAAIAGALSSLNRYPDGGGYYLTEALSKKLGVPASCILLGNGSNELIELAVRTFLMPGDTAVMGHPSFVVYDAIVRASGGLSVMVPLTDGRHDLETMADQVTPTTKFFFIANPNNPTGTMVTKREVEKALSRLPDTCLVVMDEAYVEYVTASDFPDSLALLRQGRPVLIFRTFSKAYGLAGLRIGYAIGPADVMTAMNRIRQPFNTNSLAQVAALAALGDDEHVGKTREINEAGRRYLEAELDGMGIRHLPSQTNFLFILLPEGASSGDVFQNLLRKGVIIRPAGPSAIRVTIGLPEENRRFVDAFKDWAGKAGL